MRRARPYVLAGAAAALLAACSTAAGSTPPTWVPSPPLARQGAGGGAQASPIVPVPSTPGGSAGGGPGSGQVPGGPNGLNPSSGSRKIDPNVVATNLRAPVGLAMMPDGTALVGERTTGRIVQVQPRPGRPVRTVKVLTGLDQGGDGGLLDLALSPTFTEDGLVYAYITTHTDNRVVEFTLSGPVTPVLTGIPKGASDNTARILFGADGNLYVGTGDAARPALAVKPTSLAGKVLRVDVIGDALPTNPHPPSPVWSSGLGAVDGLCAIPDTAWLLEVQAGGSGAPGEVNLLAAGASYAGASARPSVATLPKGFGAPGGCAVLGGRLWVTSLDGQALLSAPMRAGTGFVSIGPFKPALTQRYGRLRTVVAAADGALWLTTSNRDGHGNPVPADERVIRYVPTAGGGSATT
jgi:glucose/arabinose dehydrogenase